jgi:hypothetical protein
MNHHLVLTNPTLPLYDYDAVEVHPCVFDKDQNLEQFDSASYPPGATPDMWSVYLHLVGGGLECVADFTTAKAADLCAEALRATLYDHHLDKGLSVEFLQDSFVDLLPDDSDAYEQVAWMVTTEAQNGTKNTYPLVGRYKDVCSVCDYGAPVPLYTAPQPREWHESDAPEQIAILWGIDDVRQQAEEDDVELTDKQCREVLRLAKKYHDANVGVNWEVLSSYIEQVGI